MEKIKKYCYIFLVLLLFVPIAQRFFKFHISPPLEKTPVLKDMPQFHLKDWKTGEYQKLVEKFVNDNFGFRNTLLRYLNSLDFILLKVSNSPKVIIGKENHLFFDYNIINYLGVNRRDHEEIDSIMLKTEEMIQKLDTLNIKLVYVIAPSNAYYYSDKFPKQFDRYSKRENDYDYYLKKFNQFNINYIDFNQWFLDIKDTTSIDLFPKNGTHYTYFSAVWVADSLLNYLGKIKNIDVPEIIYDKVKLDSMKHQEHDLENVMNLGHKLNNEKLYQYKLKYNTTNKERPKVLVVGDSFYWPIMNPGIPSNVFENVAYWFYNLTAYPESFKKKTKTEDIDLEVLFKDLDFIVIFSSATLMHNYDYNNFSQMVIDYCDGKYSIKKEQDQINEIINTITESEDWLIAVKEKAKLKNISLNEQLENEARWILAKRNGSK